MQKKQLGRSRRQRKRRQQQRLRRKKRASIQAAILRLLRTDRQAAAQILQNRLLIRVNGQAASPVRQEALLQDSRLQIMHCSLLATRMYGAGQA